MTERTSTSGWPDKPYIVGTLDERKAISRYLTVRAARALINGNALPRWAFLRRAQHHWTAVGLSIAAKEIEEGAHATDQAVWLVDLDGGVILAREGFCNRQATPPEQGA